MDILAIRNGLKTNAGTITGLHCFQFMPDAISTPVFFSAEVDIDFDAAFGRGMDDITVTCRVLVSRADDRSGMAKLDGYLKGSGATSLKAALEADRTLGGACDSSHVRRVSGYGRYEHNNMHYLGAELFVRVIGSGA